MATEQWALGIDVSKWQRQVDWAAIRAGGISFAFIKATEAINYTDPLFAANWAGMRAAGVLRSAYHFFRPNLDPARQAAYFVQTVGQEADLPLVLDVESDGGLDKARLVKSVETALLEIERLTGRRPILYTAPNFWNTRLAYPTAPEWTGKYPLWIANYTSRPEPVVPKGWTTWTFWQYTDRGTVPGVASGVDGNRFRGGEDDLRQWAQAQSAPPAPVVAPKPDPAPAAAPETVTDLVAAYLQALHSGNLDTILALYQPNAVLVTAGKTISGAAAVREWHQALAARLPEGKFEPQQVEEVGPSWTFRWTCVSPAGRVSDGQDTLGVLNGKIAYHTSIFTLTN